MKKSLRILLSTLLILVFLSGTVTFSAFETEAASYTVFKDYTYSSLTKTQKKICDQIMKDVKSSSRSYVTRTYHCSTDDFYIVWNTINDVYFRYYSEILMDVWKETDIYSKEITDIKVKLNVKASRIRYNHSLSNEKKLKEIAAKITKNRWKKKAIVLAINSYVCRNLTYRDNLGTLDVALRTKYAKCTGYSSLFMALCELCGIPCCQVMGKAGGEEHAWNQVKLGSKWYYIDPCWNDTTDNAYTLSEKKWADHKSIDAKIYIINFRRCKYT